jgi:DNA-binding YbaB/EbfC family protein
MKMDMNKMLRQVQEMQAQMAKAQDELANETVEASAGGGMVRVKASGAGDILEVKISPEAIDPDDPEMLEDLVLAAVNEALRNVQELMQSKLGGAVGGDLGGLGLPGM